MKAKTTRELRRAVGILVVLTAMLPARCAYSQFVLTPVPELPGVSAGSLAWGDYDNDGQLDFLLSGSLAISLWHNTGKGFSNVTATVAPDLPGLYDSAVAWGDFDNDGRLDLLIAGLTNFSGGAVAQLWRNTGNSFTNLPIPGLAGVGESAVAWSDFDGDGRLDFLISGTSNGISSGAIAQLWRNTGSSFTNVPIPGLSGAYFGSIAWGDFDNDGRPDFLISGITNSATGDSICQLWRNTGSGFTNVPIAGLRGLFVTSIAWGDFDNDGRLDFLVEGLSGFTFISELWRNTGNGFTRVAVPGLPGVADGSLAWGDFNNDGRLDFLIAGTIEGDFVSQLWRNTALASNSPPAAPGGLSSVVSGDTVALSWNAPLDDHTPASGLSYNVRVGTAPGASDIASAPALADGRLLVPQTGPARNGSAALHHLLPGRTYYWSVQAVDSGFVGSPFAVEQQFRTGSLLVNLRRPSNEIFEFTFTGTPGAAFTALMTTNVGAPLNDWQVLGSVPEVAPGEFKFTDPDTSTAAQRFYRVRAP